MLSHVQESKVHPVFFWEDKHRHLEHLFILLPAFMAEHDVDSLFGPFGSAVPASLPGEAQKTLQQLKLGSISIAIFIRNPKTSIIQASEKSVNYILSKTRTPSLVLQALKESLRCLAQIICIM